MADNIYEPTWLGSPFEKWSRKYIKSNLWRVHSTMDYDDALQACAECFARCLHMYRDKVDNAAWFMSIFKLSVSNEFHTLSDKDTTSRAIMEENEYIIEKERKRVANLKRKPKEEVYSRDCYTKTIDYSPSYVNVALREASEELRTVMNIIANAPSEMLGMILAPTDDEMWSRRICRLCGIKSSHNIISELRDILEP